MSARPKPTTADDFGRGLADWAARLLLADLLKVWRYEQFAIEGDRITFVSIPDGDLPPLRVALTVTALAYEIRVPAAEEHQP